MNQLCEFGKKNKNLTKLFPELYVNESIYKTMLHNAPNMNETFAYCKLFGVWTNCSEIFFPTISNAEGFCFSFNTLNLPEFLTDEWVTFEDKKSIHS